MSLLWIGSAVGAALGLLNAAYVYGVVAGACPDESGGQRRAVYHAAWTLALWTLFGSYVLALWLVATLIYGASRAFGKWS